MYDSRWWKSWFTKRSMFGEEKTAEAPWRGFALSHWTWYFPLIEREHCFICGVVALSVPTYRLSQIECTTDRVCRGVWMARSISGRVVCKINQLRAASSWSMFYWLWIKLQIIVPTANNQKRFGTGSGSGCCWLVCHRIDSINERRQRGTIAARPLWRAHTLSGWLGALGV